MRIKPERTQKVIYLTSKALRKKKVKGRPILENV